MVALKEFIDKGFKKDILPFHNEVVLHRDIDNYRYTIYIDPEEGIAFYKSKLITGTTMEECDKQLKEHEGSKVWVAPLDIVELSTKLYKEILEAKNGKLY